MSHVSDYVIKMHGESAAKGGEFREAQEGPLFRADTAALGEGRGGEALLSGSVCL